MEKTINISQKASKEALAIYAHLKQLYNTTSGSNDTILRPQQMDHSNLLLASASLRALVFDKTPILIGFSKRHALNIKVETTESNLNLLLLSMLVCDESHISDFLLSIVLDPQVKKEFPENTTMRSFLAYRDGADFSSPMRDLDKWMPTRKKNEDLEMNVGISTASYSPAQLIKITRKIVPLEEWGNVRIGYLKETPIYRRNLITYVANKLGGVHHDYNRFPSNEEDKEQYKVLAEAYDWDDQAYMHAGFVMVAMASIELLCATNVIPLLSMLNEFHIQRQARLATGRKLDA